MPFHKRLRHKIITATTQQPVATKETHSVRQLTSIRLLSCRLFLRCTVIQHAHRCIGVAHSIPPTALAVENVNLIKALADAITSQRNDQLPEWKMSQYNGDLLQWNEWYGQFKSAIDSQSLTDNVKLTYLKTLVRGTAKTAIAEFAYCGAMYKDALRTSERKFGQPQVVVSVHLNNFRSFPPLKIAQWRQHH